MKALRAFQIGASTSMCGPAFFCRRQSRFSQIRRKFHASVVRIVVRHRPVETRSGKRSLWHEHRADRFPLAIQLGRAM